MKKKSPKPKPKTELNFEPLVPLVKERIQALNKMGWQRVPEPDIDTLATNQAKALAFLQTTPDELKGQSPLDFQATMDFAMFQIGNLDDGGKINFLNAVGHPLSNDQLVRYFFGR